jgi:hypothetical protein
MAGHPYNPIVAMSPPGTRVSDATRGDPLLAMPPRLRRFTELWIEERRRQLLAEVGTR